MKSFFILVISGLAASALARSPPNKLGPISSGGHYGSLPEKYENLTERDVTFGAAARFFIEQYRDLMDKGFADIPPLDPLHIEKPEFTAFNDHELKGEIHYTNFTLKGAKQFKLHKFETRLENGRVDFEFGVPSFYFVVDYESVVKVDQTNTFFSGLASVVLFNVTVKGTFAVEGKPQNATPAEQKLQVVGFNFNATSENAHYNLRDHALFESPKGLKSSNNEASEVVKVLARGLAKVTSQSVVETIAKGANKIFGNFTTAQVLGVGDPNKA